MYRLTPTVCAYKLNNAHHFNYKTTSFEKWHTIKPGLAQLAWNGLKVGLASILASKLAPKKFWHGFKSWPGLKFGPMKNAWPQISK